MTDSFICRFDDAGRFSQVSLNCLLMFGFFRRRDQARSIFALLEKDDSAMLKDMLRQDGQSWSKQVELCFIRKDGSVCLTDCTWNGYLPVSGSSSSCTDTLLISKFRYTTI